MTVISTYTSDAIIEMGKPMYGKNSSEVNASESPQ